jgi:hypothetical protein
VISCFNQTCEDIGATRKFVVYGGDDEFPAGHGATVISLRGLMNKLTVAGSTAGVERPA